MYAVHKQNITAWNKPAWVPQNMVEASHIPTQNSLPFGLKDISSLNLQEDPDQFFLAIEKQALDSRVQYERFNNRTTENFEEPSNAAMGDEDEVHLIFGK